MARRSHVISISFTFPEAFDTSKELEAFCVERDKTRADAAKDILIAWAIARRGNFSALSGVLGVMVTAVEVTPGLTTAPEVPIPPTTPIETQKPTGKRRTFNNNASVVDLDL